MNGRRYIWYDELVRDYPKLRKALRVSKRTFDNTDLMVFEYKGKVYAESHDEYSLCRWDNEKLVDMNFLTERETTYDE